MITPNEWESDFFNKKIGQLHFPADLTNISQFALIQAKVPAGELTKIDFLQQNQFHFVEGELDFVLDIKGATKEQNPHIKIASSHHSLTLQQFVTTAFSHSRFRPPYFSEKEKQDFYQEWIKNSISGKFDNLCLTYQKDNKLLGIITLRQLTPNTCRIGLLAVAEKDKRKGIGSHLLSAAQQWTYEQGAKKLYVATQLSNLSAIRFYQKHHAQIEQIAYWYYREENNDSL